MALENTMVSENFSNGDLAAWLRVTSYVLWHNVTDTLLCRLPYGFLPRFYVMIQAGPSQSECFVLNESASQFNHMWIDFFQWCQKMNLYLPQKSCWKYFTNPKPCCFWNENNLRKGYEWVLFSVLNKLLRIIKITFKDNEFS